MANPRLDRLQNDFRHLSAIVARSDFIQIMTMEGSPPYLYVVRFTSRGIKELSGGQPVYSEDHQVRIQLGPQYPLAKPDLRWLTPIFHPHISVGGSVCIGNEWSSGGRYLDDLVIFLAQMVRYEGADLTFAFNDKGFNPAAHDWAMRNRHLFPVDARPLLKAELKIDILGEQPLNIQVKEPKHQRK
jgi:hypothetical protein